MEDVTGGQRTAYADTVAVICLSLSTSLSEGSGERIELVGVVMAEGSLRGVMDRIRWFWSDASCILMGGKGLSKQGFNPKIDFRAALSNLWKGGGWFRLDDDFVVVKY